VVLNLNDPASIRAWIAVWPERHRWLLRSMWRLWPQFRDAIEEGAKQ
jgi:hypothetical protein